MLARLRNDPVIHYSAAVDCWALGCVIYECLAGQPPFWSDDDVKQVRASAASHQQPTGTARHPASQRHLTRRSTASATPTAPSLCPQSLYSAPTCVGAPWQVHLILRNRLDFPDEAFGEVSDDAKDVIRGLLQPDASTRLTIAEVLQAPWFTREEGQLAERLFPTLPRPQAKTTGTRRKSNDYRRKFSHAYAYDAAKPSPRGGASGASSAADLLGLGAVADAELLALLNSDPDDGSKPASFKKGGSFKGAGEGAAATDPATDHGQIGPISQLEVLLSGTTNAQPWKATTESGPASIRRSNTQSLEWQGPFARRGSVQMKMEVREALNGLSN